MSLVPFASIGRWRFSRCRSVDGAANQRAASNSRQGRSRWMRGRVLLWPPNGRHRLLATGNRSMRRQNNRKRREMKLNKNRTTDVRRSGRAQRAVFFSPFATERRDAADAQRLVITKRTNRFGWERNRRDCFVVLRPTPAALFCVTDDVERGFVVASVFSSAVGWLGLSVLFFCCLAPAGQPCCLLSLMDRAQLCCRFTRERGR